MLLRHACAERDCFFDTHARDKSHFVGAVEVDKVCGSYLYRGASLILERPPVGPYGRTMPRALP